MEHKHGITIHWALLLIVYLAVLFATVMVSLTSDSGSSYVIVLLTAGVPIYVVSSGAIMRDPEASALLDGGETNAGGGTLISFPGRSQTRTPGDMTPPAIDTPSTRRKAG